MDRVITLLTDFGTADAYVGIMKGVILAINPEAEIVDISHQVESQNIEEAAFILSTSYSYFPEDTIHLVVVDPGVGTERRAIILKARGFLFVAPDNGVLSYIIDEVSASDEVGPHQRRLGAESTAVSITNPGFWLHPVSSTFHGRDIFAPVAAHLSLGVPIREFGDPIASVFTLPVLRPQTGEDGVLIGHIVHIDRFGNLITDVRREDIPGEEISIEVAGRHIEGLSSSYAEGEGLMALIGSSGRIEVSLRNGNAARALEVKPGDKITIRGR